MSKILKRIRNVKPYKPGKPIEEVKRSLGLKEVYKLASNEIPFVPTHIKEAVNKEIANVNRYPEATSFYLRKQVAKMHKVDVDQIVFGNGSDETIVLALKAFVDQGDEVVVAYPTFLIYEIQANINGAKVIRVPLRDNKYDLKKMAEKITKKTKIIFIANPDNPTGTYLTDKQISKFLNCIPKDVVVFLDEAYYEFAPSDFSRSMNYLKKRGNIIFTRTFSKAYGLAGLRVGYAITTKEIADVLNTIREPFNINRFAQVAAVEALKNKEFLSKVVGYVNKEKEYLYREFKKLGVVYVESATNFILVDFKSDTDSLNDHLLKNGVIIRQLKGWGLKNFFRVTAGLHKENKKFIDCLKSYLEKR